MIFLEGRGKPGREKPGREKPGREKPVYDEDDYYYYEDEDYASSCDKVELQTQVDWSESGFLVSLIMMPVFVSG